jgi:hypothetical protein
MHSSSTSGLTEKDGTRVGLCHGGGGCLGHDRGWGHPHQGKDDGGNDAPGHIPEPARHVPPEVVSNTAIRCSYGETLPTNRESFPSGPAAVEARRICQSNGMEQQLHPVSVSMSTLGGGAVQRYFRQTVTTWFHPPAALKPSLLYG